MIERYLKQDGQGAIEYFRRDDGKDPDNSRFEYTDKTGSWAVHYPPHDLLVANGYRKYSKPELAEHQEAGVLYIWTSETVTSDVVAWSQERIDADVLRQVNEALFLLTEANAELVYWVEKTPQEITEIIAAAPNTFVSFKQMIEKNAQSIRIMALLFKLLRDTGRIA